MQGNRLLLLLLSVLFVWLRLPSINEGMPYFYNEDEAHHFNRTVNMVKSGQFNPKYFHKPSLHFYLRMPVVAASFLWSVSKGEIRSVTEIVTQSKEGVGGYAFSASHPRIVKWNRAFSVSLLLGTAILCFLVVQKLIGCRVIASFAFLLTAFSPELIKYGAVIGVDVVMTFFVTLSTYLAFLSIKAESRSQIFFSAIAAGLAVSSKYNALPILIVPLLAASFYEKRLQNFAVSLALFVAAFVVGSPFVLAELPMFLDQFAYEIWHYGIAGHEGHSAEPGLSQAFFYLKWLNGQALGLPLLIAAVAGAFLHARKSKKEAIILAAFPLTFLMLMISQRANFERNMIVVLPYFAIFGAIFIARVAGKSRALGVLALVICLAFPAYKSFGVRTQQKSISDSRNDLSDWLLNNKGPETAVAADIEIAQSALKVPGVSEVSKERSPAELYVEGFDRFVKRPSTYPFSEQIRAIEGEKGEQRIVVNPAVSIYELKKDLIDRDTLNSTLESRAMRGERIEFVRNEESFVCRQGSEDYCWIKDRIARVYLKDLTLDPNFSGRDGLTRLVIELMSPWDNQDLQATFEDFLAFVPIVRKAKGGQWETITVDLPYQELKSSGYFILNSSVVKSPYHWLGLADKRRLAVAIKSIKIELR